MNRNLQVVIFFLFILQVSVTSAQENSPYTRFGLGDLQNTSPAEINGWGGPNAAFQSASAFDISNPASLASLYATPLNSRNAVYKLAVFQAGLSGRVMDVSNGSTKDYFGYSSPAYLTLAMAVKKDWGISFGLLPYSNVNYNVYQLNDAGNGLPQSANQFKGSGGLYQVYLASGWAIKNFSFGVSGAYLFGTLTNDSKQIFTDTLNGFNTNNEVDRSVGSFIWNAGLQYDLILGKKDEKTGIRNGDDQVIFGLSGHTAITVNAHQNSLIDRFYYDPNLGTETAYDTLQSSFNQKGKIVIPAVINVGIIWKHKEKWQVGINYTYNNFNAYRSFGNTDSMTTNSYRVGIGAEYIPKWGAEEGYFNFVKFRLGAYYGDYYLSFNNYTLKNYGFTVGLGLPVRVIKLEDGRKVSSDIDLSFDFGTLGTTQNNLVRESYIKAIVGIKFGDRWFRKRQYD